MTSRSPDDRESPNSPTDLSDWTKSGGPPTTGGSHPPETRAFTPGTLLANRYRIVALLGTGGMGEIYRAEDTKLGQPVALKFMRSTMSPEVLERFYSEVRIGRQVSHPNVCRLYDIVEFEGDTFLTMEYVDGEDLGSLLARIGRLPPDKALDLARDPSAGLAAVHDRGVVHRDLKPANVMVDGRRQARLTDFGLALPLRFAARRPASRALPSYMSPEQLEGRPPTQRSDLYALGLISLRDVHGSPLLRRQRRSSELRSQHKAPKTRAPRSSSLAARARLWRGRSCSAWRRIPRPGPPPPGPSLLCSPGAIPSRPRSPRERRRLPSSWPRRAAAATCSAGAAWACLLAVFAGVLAVAVCFDQAGLMNRRTLPRTPEWLAERSRDLLDPSWPSGAGGLGLLRRARPGPAHSRSQRPHPRATDAVR